VHHFVILALAFFSGTFHFAAAALSSMVRAVAPATRIGS